MAGWFTFALRCLQKIQGGCLALLGVGWEGVLARKGSCLSFFILLGKGCMLDLALV